MPIKATLRDGIIYQEVSGEIDYDMVIEQIDYMFP